jgi:hypothetical protein
VAEARGELSDAPYSPLVASLKFGCISALSASSLNSIASMRAARWVTFSAGVAIWRTSLSSLPTSA